MRSFMITPQNLSQFNTTLSLARYNYQSLEQPAGCRRSQYGPTMSEEKTEVTRRSFIKGAGSVVGGAAVTGVTPLTAAADPVKLTLLDPTGAQEITHLFAVRLPNLDGKVIAELAVDPTKWQPHRTMPYIEELLRKQYPDLKFIAMQEFPMGIQISEDRVIQMVAARKPDAVIIGNAG
jgi:hypothetical protein